MRFLNSLLIAFSLFSSSCLAGGPSSCSAVLASIETHRPHEGVLKQSAGFVYVDVEDAYVHDLTSLLQQEGFEEPPYFGSSDLVGAHITVIYPSEMEKYRVQEMEECGEWISFTPLSCQIVHPPRWEGVEEVYLLVVEAPELDRIRAKYGLPKIEHPFHLTLGVKRVACSDRAS